MPDKIYFLSTCDTGKKMFDEVQINRRKFEWQDIKAANITAAQLDKLKEQAGSYEALFSKRALLYKEWGLAQKGLTEKDFRKYILEHYTFLKRPVVEYKGQLFIGSEKKNIAALKEALDNI